MGMKSNNKNMGRISIKSETLINEKESVKKFIFKTEDGRVFEASSFWQPDLNRYDLCVSSMSGCLMGCKICDCTYNRMGNESGLSVDELAKQIEIMIEDARDFIVIDKKPFPWLTNYKFDTEKKYNTMVLVSFMGNGDPLCNIKNVIEAIEISCEKYSHLISRFGISTIGPVGIDLADAMQQILRCTKKVKKEIWMQYSVICMDEKKRRELLPGAIPLREAAVFMDEYARDSKRHSRYNFPMIRGINNSKEHLDQIANFISENIDLRAVKLSMYNELSNNVFEPCSKGEVIEAKKYLEKNDLGLIYYYFPESGKKLSAACGQMRARYEG